jgi:PAS domain-containing protein
VPADGQTLTQHRAVADLARSEERYALAVRAANDGIWDWDLISDTLYLSPRWHAILGAPSPREETWAPRRGLSSSIPPT